MASYQSKVTRFLIKQMNVFGNDDIREMILSRKRFEMIGYIMPVHPRVKREKINAHGVPCDWLVPEGSKEDRAILYIHGGAFYQGSSRTHSLMTSILALKSNSPALSVNYRLAPENPFPAGLDDCIKAYRWLLDQGIEPEKIVIAGDSAGGNLAISMLLKLRDKKMVLPAATVAISPVTDLSGEIGRSNDSTYWSRAEVDPIFHNADIHSVANGESAMIRAYTTNYDLKHPYISPLYADLRGLPPILIHVGDYEILLNDSVEFARRAESFGVNVECKVWPQMFHVFHMWTPVMPEANQAIKELAKFIRHHQHLQSIIY